MIRSVIVPFGLAWMTLALFLPAPAGAAARPTAPLSFDRGSLVVIVDREAIEAGEGARAFARDARLAAVLARHGLAPTRRVDPVAAVPARREAIWELSSTRPDFDPVAAAREIQGTGTVLAASPNYRFGLFITQPNDPYLSFQWYVNDGGIDDIGLPYAWDVERGDSSVVIAIMDTGVDTGHPDLASRIWNNPGEIPANGLDDDGNGFLDDHQGWDFGREDNNPNPEYTSDPSGIDVGFHGTFCAGIAAAATNNGVGIAGAGWNCRIMPLKVSHPDSGITSVALAGAFAYAMDEGASVISMSFGGPGQTGVPEFFQALVDMATHAGALCVAAAGNDGSGTPMYPAACPNVLAVGATDESGGRASFSNWGPWVDAAAPGARMWSTICRNYTFTELDQLYYQFLWEWNGNTPYMYGDGTSFSCPLVAGVCGLVRSRFPYLTPGLVAQHVAATGDPIAFDQPIGRKVNALAAVSATPTAVPLGPAAPGLARVEAVPNPVPGSGAIRFALSAEGPVRLVLHDASGRRVRFLVDGVRPAGSHVVSWDGRNDAGGRVAAGVYFVRLESGGEATTGKLVKLGR